MADDRIRLTKPRQLAAELAAKAADLNELVDEAQTEGLIVEIALRKREWPRGGKLVQVNVSLPIRPEAPGA